MLDPQRRLLAVVLATSCAISLFAHYGYGQGPQQKAQLYFFTNAACGPCRVVEPELEKLYRAGYPVMKIDTHLHPDWTRRFAVRKTPTVMLVAGQQVVARHSGYIDAESMLQWFSRLENSESHSPRGLRESGPQPDLPPTFLKGTSRPATEAEKLAMQATVRLKVEDGEGSSYATGTIIHLSLIHI